jgi:hypothetical protein
MSEGNTKAQSMTGTISTESILITVESNWIQMLLHVKRERDKQDVRDIRASLDSGADGPGPRSVRIRSE